VKTTLIAAAAAFSFAAPAAAQPASAAAPASTCTAEHAAMGHCTMAARPGQAQSRQENQTPSGAQAAAQARQTMSHGQMSGCCRDANGNGKMDCCENMGAAVPGATSGHAPAPQPQAHQGH
jgi:hypothetical protein